MLKLLAVLLLALPSFGQTHCGSERWPVKVLQDSDFKLIQWQIIKQATVSEVVRYAPPPDVRLKASNSKRLAWEEKVVWQIEGALVGIKEEADGDYHLVIADRKDLKTTMVVEIPSPGCIAKTYKEEMTMMRSALSLALPFKINAEYKRIAPVPVIITGVGFYDFVHGQIGAAKNGFEIHPVTQIEVDEDSAHHINSGSNPCLIKKDCVPTQVGGMPYIPLQLDDEE